MAGTGTKTAGTATNAAKPEPTEDEQQASGRRTAEGDPADTGTDTGTVKYVGDAGVREISKADWKTVGIEAETNTWDASNDYTILKSVFTAEQLEILKRDRGFKISS